MDKNDDIVAKINRKNPDGVGQNGKPYRVLVVDDSLVMRKMIIQILKSEEYDICGEAENGIEALEMYKNLKPDLVTLDINMPKECGMVALRRLLSEDPNARIVMLTSEGQKESVVKAISLGAKNYIVKPPERRNVLEKLKSALPDNGS